jgi:dTDP-4-dehydrorhamnose 3,5-epimerase
VLLIVNKLFLRLKMSFKIIHTKIPGCFQIIFNKIEDSRGGFVKTFHIHSFKQLGIDMTTSEEYFTYSVKNVFRGLHFQLPPMDLDKIVCCLSGSVTDFVVDLRKGSPTYKQWLKFELDGHKPSAVFVPLGLAHGFHVKSNNAIMHYKVSKTYDVKYDTGISYKSFEFAEEIVNPIISERDSKFALLEEFDNPFKFSS